MIKKKTQLLSFIVTCVLTAALLVGTVYAQGEGMVGTPGAAVSEYSAGSPSGNTAGDGDGVANGADGIVGGIEDAAEGVLDGAESLVDGVGDAASEALDGDRGEAGKDTHNKEDGNSDGHDGSVSTDENGMIEDDTADDEDGGFGIVWVVIILVVLAAVAALIVSLVLPKR